MFIPFPFFYDEIAVGIMAARGWERCHSQRQEQWARDRSWARRLSIAPC